MSYPRDRNHPRTWRKCVDRWVFVTRPKCVCGWHYSVLLVHPRKSILSLSSMGRLRYASYDISCHYHGIRLHLYIQAFWRWLNNSDLYWISACWCWADGFCNRRRTESIFFAVKHWKSDWHWFCSTVLFTARASSLLVLISTKCIWGQIAWNMAMGYATSSICQSMIQSRVSASTRLSQRFQKLLLFTTPLAVRGWAFNTFPSHPRELNRRTSLIYHPTSRHFLYGDELTSAYRLRRSRELHGTCTRAFPTCFTMLPALPVYNYYFKLETPYGSYPSLYRFLDSESYPDSVMFHPSCFAHARRPGPL
jgi:hypothetical protein